jgi:hypothetical protein
VEARVRGDSEAILCRVLDSMANDVIAIDPEDAITLAINDLLRSFDAMSNLQLASILSPPLPDRDGVAHERRQNRFLASSNSRG